MPATRLQALGVNPIVADRVVRGFADGSYQLLCGAGTSLEAPGGDGKLLALAKATANDIADTVGLVLEPEERNDLSFVYEEAGAQFPDKLRRFLLGRFTKCSPTWQSKILSLHWQRIWTLNIDDVLENTFLSMQDSTRYGRLSSISWRDQLRPPSASERELQVIHLHGIAERLHKSRDDVVFSPLEYSEVVRALPPWHAAFQTSYVEDPFIICGAKFTEEPDFVVATRISNQSEAAVGIPSLIVTPSFTEAQKTRLRRFGLVPVEAFGETFFDALHADLASFRRVHAEALKRYPPGVIERFSQQFRRLVKGDVVKPLSVDSDFYGGDQPTWDDIVSGKDIELTRTQYAARLMHDAGPRCFGGLLFGGFATGKSAALLRLGASALSHGLQPYLFRNEDSVDVSSAVAFLELTPGAVLLFDDAADHSAAIGKIVSACAKKKTRCRIYAAERVNRIRGFRLDILDDYRHEFHFRALSESDVDRMISSRRFVGRLGRYSQSKDEEVRELMLGPWRRELLECLSQIEFGEGFRTRIAKYVRGELADRSDLGLVGAIACTHRFGFELPLRIALSFSKTVERFKKVLDAGASSEGLVVRDSGGVRLRHRIVSEYVWRDVLSPEERYSAILSVATNLAPLINPATIAAKSRPHRIVRELLDQAALVDDVGLEARKLFDELETYYAWSSRFWDQRALLEYRLENQGKAYSYSQKAVSLEKHAFAFTTLGTICLKESVRLLGTEAIRAKQLYFEGVDSLDLARRASERQGMSFEHPFVAFFSQTIRLAKGLPSEDPDFGAISELWKVWLANARSSECFQGRFGSERLRDVEAMWMKIQLSRARAGAQDAPSMGGVRQAGGGSGRRRRR